MIEAKVICDSVSPQGIRLTTMALRYPKFIHGELMTHRVFSRNASSSRAVPTSKLIGEVRNDALRASPIFWGKNQPGMQAREELSDQKDGLDLSTGWNEADWERETTGWGNDAFHNSSPRERAQHTWKVAALSAANWAGDLVKSGAHKEITNRLLEPFSHINVLVTATEWDNFFGLRLHRDAQPEMRALAVAMWEARVGSTPTILQPNEWHLPYISFEKDAEQLGEVTKAQKNDHLVAIKCSVARCARVSYTSFETGKRSTVEEDLALHDRLMSGKPLHASPAEHQATPDRYAHQTEGGGWESPQQHGNFRGWRQYRKMLPGEAVAPLPVEYDPDAWKDAHLDGGAS